MRDSLGISNVDVEAAMLHILQYQVLVRGFRVSPRGTCFQYNDERACLIVTIFCRRFDSLVRWYLCGAGGVEYVCNFLFLRLE